MHPVDRLVRDRVAPLLHGAGFTGKGRHFQRAEPTGSTAYVDVVPFALGRLEVEVHVDLGVQPRVWAAFLAHRGLSTRDPLWASRLMVPGRAGAMADHWSFDLAEEEASHLLLDSLEVRLREVVGLLDPSQLLAYARTLPHVGRRITVRPEVAQAALLAELGASEELERRLAALATDRGDGWIDFDRAFVDFVRSRLVGQE